MATPKIEIKFNSAGKYEWLKQVCEIHSAYALPMPNSDIVLDFSSDITSSQLEPLHLVTLACLIEYLFSRGHKVYMSRRHKELHNYIFNDLNFSAYWSGGKNHVNAKVSGDIFNLWRIVETEKDLYAKNVEIYLNNTYFADKDLSAINVSLVEAFYNVFDHAKAKNNAFSLLKYDKEKNKLLVAIADFGIGIARSVRNFKRDIESDMDAICWAIQDHSTVKSTEHNKGLGMGNILASASSARIFSGNGLVVINAGQHKTYEINFKFPGTIIYLDVDLSTFEDMEILESFNW